jgi:hypothetical protein
LVIKVVEISSRDPRSAILVVLDPNVHTGRAIDDHFGTNRFTLSNRYGIGQEGSSRCSWLKEHWIEE